MKLKGVKARLKAEETSINGEKFYSTDTLNLLNMSERKSFLGSSETDMSMNYSFMRPKKMKGRSFSSGSSANNIMDFHENDSISHSKAVIKCGKEDVLPNSATKHLNKTNQDFDGENFKILLKSDDKLSIENSITISEPANKKKENFIAKSELLKDHSDTQPQTTQGKANRNEKSSGKSKQISNNFVNNPVVN
jgi:hypothetical protein